MTIRIALVRASRKPIEAVKAVIASRKGDVLTLTGSGVSSSGGVITLRGENVSGADGVITITD